jgi:hypothetical protein
MTLKENKKAFTCMFKQETIVILREAAQSEKLSQGAFLEKTIEYYLEGNRSTNTPSSDGTEPTIEPIVEYFKKIIATKDSQINKLIESQLQHNQIVAMFHQRNEQLIEHQNLETKKPKKNKENEVDRTYTNEGSTTQKDKKRSKKSKKKGGGKKKK